MRIAEIYASLQGEGSLAGTPSTFVRSSGCNLRCRWCDTPFTSWEPAGDDWTVAKILDRVAALGRRHVVVTGGEPLLFPEVVPLCDALRNAGRHVTIETAGTVLPAGAAPASTAVVPPADLMSISPKLASSGPAAAVAADWHRRHEAARRRDDVLLALMAGGHYQLKFVIDSPDDLAGAIRWVEDLERADGAAIDRGRIFLMPQGRTDDELSRTTAWLAAECERRGVRLAPRHHIAWFGDTRGT